jgi:AraC-like DNA-binding protein
LLSLRSLSRQIGEKTHYVSQVINQDLGTNYYELVNRRRIQRAQELLIASPEQTVLEIALSVGFNSKSTFNTAFRRLTGMTPTDFRRKSPPSGD